MVKLMHVDSPISFFGRIESTRDRVSYLVTRADQFGSAQGAVVFVVDVYPDNRKEVTERRYQSYNW